MKEQNEFFNHLEGMLTILLSGVRTLKGDGSHQLNQSEQSSNEDQLKSQPSTAAQEGDTYLNFEEMCDFLGIAKSTGYQRISRGEIPNFKKGRRLYFKRSELLKYIESGRRMTSQDIDQIADEHLRNFQKRQ